MPQGKGTYGSQVGRPSKKRTSYVNDNNWFDKLSDYDFGQSRKEEYVGPGTGSITITPDRKGYSKTGSGKRMKISEKNTWKRSLDYGIQQAKAGARAGAEAAAAIDAMGAERSKPSPKPADVSSQFSEETLASGAVPNYSKHQRDLHRQARRRVVGKVRNVKNSRGQIIGN